jgi:hypothetical protein
MASAQLKFQAVASQNTKVSRRADGEARLDEKTDQVSCDDDGFGVFLFPCDSYRRKFSRSSFSLQGLLREIGTRSLTNLLE